jgi:hypothetical protein
MNCIKQYKKKGFVMGELVMGVFLGIILTADILFVRFKFNRQGFFPAALDVALLVLIDSVIGGTIMGEIIGTIAAFFMSIWLYWYPPKLVLVFKRKEIGYR